MRTTWTALFVLSAYMDSIHQIGRVIMVSYKQLIRDAEIALIDEIEEGMAEMIKKARASLKEGYSKGG